MCLLKADTWGLENVLLHAEDLGLIHGRPLPS